MSRLIIGTECTTGANSALGAPPTSWAGESVDDELGVRRLQLAQLADQQVEVGVGDLGFVELVVAAVVVGDELAEHGEACRDVLLLVRSGDVGHDA